MNDRERLILDMREVVQVCQDAGLTFKEARNLFLKLWMAESLVRAKNNQSVLADREHIHRNTVRRILKAVSIVPNKSWKISRHENA